jgi:hypothetical protein
MKLEKRVQLNRSDQTSTAAVSRFLQQGSALPEDMLPEGS